MSEAKPTINEALAAVMGEVRAVGKNDRNESQRFNFRGIDAVVNAVGPALRKHGVLVLPTVQDHSYSTVTSSRGTPMGHVIVRVQYDFIGPAGDRLICSAVGEAMDVGDKATPKAMSVAFRTALLQSLTLPTDEVDPDAETYERGAPAKVEHADSGAVQDLISGFVKAGSEDDVAAIAAKIPTLDLSSDDKDRLRLAYAAAKARVAA